MLYTLFAKGSSERAVSLTRASWWRWRTGSAACCLVGWGLKKVWNWLFGPPSPKAQFEGESSTTSRLNVVT